MRYNYYKLVRNNIPNEINKVDNRKCSYKILSDEEYKNELDKKLQEESIEFIECHSVEEMADLLEVIDCQIKTFNINMDEVNKLNNYGSIESEIVDVFYVLSCVCNKLDINILDVLKKKETENVNRKWNKV